MPPMRPQRGKTPRKRGKTGGSTSDVVEPVEVYCRVRPLDNPGDAVCLTVVSNDTVKLLSSENTLAFARTGQLKEIQYKFQHVFDEYTSQKAVFDHVAYPLIDDLVHGKNGLLFTYGITSSGKTYTMTGTPQDQGILPRCLDVIFNSIGEYQCKKYVFKPDKMNGFEVQTEADAMMDRQRKDILPGLTPKTPGTPRIREKYEFGRDCGRLVDPSRVNDVDEDNTYAVFVSYIEIYNNYVYDLLEELPYDPITGYKAPQSKFLRTDSCDNMYVMSCTEVEIKSPEEAFEVLYKGQKRRKVAHTALNAESSRSHSIFNIRLVQAPLDPCGQEVLQDNEKIFVSQLSLVDLAGSERVNRTNNKGDRLKEAGNINQTLMSLRTCLEMLRENQMSGGNKMVPYRDSKLTHLFKNYFDGDGRVRMVVCVNPKAEEFDETVHVMKFAEMSQEVMVQRSQQVKFDLGLTPGRRRLGEKLREERMREEAEREKEREMMPVPSPSLIYSLGPDFPNLELVDYSDEETLRKLIECLCERDTRRQTLLIDFEAKGNQFRNYLLDFERDYDRLKERNEELEAVTNKHGSTTSKLESKCRSLEQKVSSLQQQLNEADRMRREFEAKLYDKNMKIRQEQSEKERLKDNFKQRLEMNNIHWEDNLDKERRKIERELGMALEEKEKKFSMMKEVLDSETPIAKPRTFKTPATSTKTRTYTTPGVIQSARSESDVSSIGVPTPRTRTTSAVPSVRPWGYGGNNKRPVPKTPTATPRSIPQYNLRHRRSKSNTETWLDHKPQGHLDLDTVLQPSLKKKKSVSKLDTKDTKMASKYMLTDQGLNSDGEFQTRYFKGDVIPTSGGGASVVFNDVEIHKQKEPGTRKRRSSCPQPTDFDGEWTDPEERCAIAIEGHRRKRSKQSPELVSVV
ncbi:kinesin-like protein KIF23 isoform X1 [Mercenaria mercenaria]|uniref:kinesin-like protein KIF23 isoform X1 n=1 Tax=Mercenaria mercenaria TaxID=6596 RepID=UPI00234F4711|nr:kinesin-like protein KIF23 isoform X1 [Mercenaria mercenaria]